MNTTLFANVKNRANTVNEAGGRAYRLPPKHALAQLAATGCFNGAFYADAEAQLADVADAGRPGRRQRLPGQAGGLQPRARVHEGHAGGPAAGPVEARPGSVPPGLRPRRRQRPGAAHAVPDAALGPVWPQEPVVLAAAGVPALAERGQRRHAAVGLDRQRSEPARCSALARPTPVDNARRALFGWLTDKPIEKWAPATLADLPEEVSRPDGLPRRRDRGGAGCAPGAAIASAGTCWPMRARARPSGRRLPPDGPAGAAHEPQHAAAARRFRRCRDGEPRSRAAWPTRTRSAVSRQFPYQYLAALPERRGRAAGRLRKRAGAGGRDRLRQRAGTAGPGRDRPGRVRFDGVGSHGQARRRRHQQDALRGRRGPVRGRHPAAQPGQRGRAVRHRGLRGRSDGRETRS